MKDWSKGGVEPSVAEILSDPIVHLMMQRDGVALDDMRTLVHAARVSLPGGPGDASGKVGEQGIVG